MQLSRYEIGQFANNVVLAVSEVDHSAAANRNLDPYVHYQFRVAIEPLHSRLSIFLSSTPAAPGQMHPALCPNMVSFYLSRHAPVPSSHHPGDLSLPVLNKGTEWITKRTILEPEVPHGPLLFDSHNQLTTHVANESGIY